MIPKFIRSPSDLQTTHSSVCQGFLDQARAKTEKAGPFIAEAKDFYLALKTIDSHEQLNLLSSNKDYKDKLATACGFSDKAKAKLTDAELTTAIEKILPSISDLPDAHFREDILYRYLLTRGDTLGGTMRNLTGARASSKLVDNIINKLSKRDHTIKRNKSAKVQRIDWHGRALLFDVTPPLVNKNIDMVLIKCRDSTKTNQTLLSMTDSYLACGELKGGIDPAGADEHWKTANSALSRIREAFNQNAPALFFIGAAIESAMAEEIYSQLKTGKLTHAANLNDEQQVGDLINWLLSL